MISFGPRVANAACAVKASVGILPSAPGHGVDVSDLLTLGPGFFLDLSFMGCDPLV